MGMEDPVFYIHWPVLATPHFFVPLSISLWVWKPLFRSLLAVIWAWKTLFFIYIGRFWQPLIFRSLIYFSMGMETPLSVTVGCHLGMEDPVFIYIGRFWQSFMFFRPLIYLSMGMETPPSVTVGCDMGMEDPDLID